MFCSKCHYELEVDDLYDTQGKRVWETTGLGKETLKEIETEINRVLEQ